MRKLFIALIVFTAAALALNTKLYLKDGSYQMVREYKVQGDRIRYYSIERSSWEEIPVEMVDLKRTEAESSSRQSKMDEEAKLISAEDKVQRELEDEIAKIPQNPGTYFMINGEAKKLRNAESKVHTKKGRSILKALSPVPLVPGKATVEIENAHSMNIINVDRPEFYVQLENEERFDIVKLTPKTGLRIVENLTIMPVTNEAIEEPVIVKTFNKQMTNNGLYKIWPEAALEPGEYAVVEYTPGKLNMQVWDFQYKPGDKVQIWDPYTEMYGGKEKKK